MRDRALVILKGAKEILSAAIRAAGLPFLARHTYGRRRVAILMYHEPSPELLRRHLAYLASRYAFVTLDEVVEALHSGRWDRLPTPSVVITVDDGKRSSYAFFPLFRRYGIVPTLYVCSQLVGTNRHFWFDVHPDCEALKSLPHEQRIGELEALGTFALTMEYPATQRTALSMSEIAEMGEAVEIQAHTRFHPVLTTCCDEVCLDEIATSRIEIEERIRRPCRHFCYPNGDYTERELEMVRKSGYRSARTIRTGWTGPRSDPYQLEILGVDDYASVNQLAADMAGLGFLEGFIRRARPDNPTGRHRPITLAPGS